ncbi:rpp14 protein family [Grosmannia clavigera kw1407]|uniref:Ribonuclease P/MRP protein subunit POP5 n=1 Tax=Grosmannia clavigera (strain kw1407 / UAMH 11150) TaxID=655863 RepID=F0XGM2_GROCL|nr:rpp14 protein family [Grosmannia clavigera kw1407]EFX02718.1 rpp14 protein family [Grosmannia clavigera kw1407]
MVRIKERYILVNILYPRSPTEKSSVPDFVAFRQPTQNDLTPQLLLRAIKNEVFALFGDCGAGAVERTLSVKYLSKTTSTAILRITREHLRYVWTALTFMRHVPIRGGRPCIFRVAHVSGTIRKVEEEAIRQSRALVLATKAHVAGQTASAFDLLTKTAAKDPAAVALDADESGDEEGSESEDTDDGVELADMDDDDYGKQDGADRS